MLFWFEQQQQQQQQQQSTKSLFTKIASLLTDWRLRCIFAARSQRRENIYHNNDGDDDGHGRHDVDVTDVVLRLLLLQQWMNAFLLTF